MIETSQSVTVGCGIAQVWDFVKDIRRWAELMPGLQECELINEDDSHWTLKVGVGALVRTVRVNVHVDQWDGPGRAVFSYKLQGDPVQGGGSYQATALGHNKTEIALTIRIEGSGPMAPMWEAMGAPLLPKFALAFSRQLRDGIEASLGIPSVASAATGSAGGFMSKLLSLLRVLFGRGSR